MLMKILGFACILFVVCYVIGFYKRVFDIFLGILFMDFVSCLRFLRVDFGFGFLVFRCFRLLVWGLVLYLFFGFGLKFVQVGWQCWGFAHCFCLLGCVWTEFRTGFGSKNGFDVETIPKILSCELEDRFLIGKDDENKECVDESDDEDGCTLKSEVVVKSNLKFSSCQCGLLENRFMIEDFDEDKECMDESDNDVKTNSKFLSCKCGFLEDRSMIEKFDEDKECIDESDDEHECHDVDKECDVVKLRKLVKIERGRADAAYVELEKERMAAATAAGETMAMILRLQNEKSVIEMEAHQYRRLAEEKQLHDQEVIESLRWIAMSCQSAVIQLEDQLRSVKQKVELHLKDDEGYQSEGNDKSFSSHNFNFEGDALDDRLISSLDLALSSCINESHLATPSHRTN